MFTTKKRNTKISKILIMVITPVMFFAFLIGGILLIDNHFESTPINDGLIEIGTYETCIFTDIKVGNDYIESVHIIPRYGYPSNVLENNEDYILEMFVSFKQQGIIKIDKYEKRSNIMNNHELYVEYYLAEMIIHGFKFSFNIKSQINVLDVLLTITNEVTPDEEIHHFSMIKTSGVRGED